MATWIQLYEAHRSSALSAYGYADVTARIAAMSPAFARALLDGWAAIGNQARANVPDKREPFLGIFEFGDDTNVNLLDAAVAHLQNDSETDAPAVIWAHVFSLASLLDQGYIAGPSISADFSASAENVVSYVRDTAQAAAGIISQPLGDIAIIVVAVLFLVLLLKFK